MPTPTPTPTPADADSDSDSDADADPDVQHRPWPLRGSKIVRDEHEQARNDARSFERQAGSLRAVGPSVEPARANSSPNEPVRAEPSDGVTDALARALLEASAGRRWDVVAQLARELEARRTAKAGGNVVALDAKARRRDAGREG
jgi:hypothetical protein